MLVLKTSISRQTNCQGERRKSMEAVNGTLTSVNLPFDRYRCVCGLIHGALLAVRGIAVVAELTERGVLDLC